MRPWLVLLLLCVAYVEGQTLPSRFFNDGRDVDVALVFAGHEKHQMTLTPTWQLLSLNHTNASILLPPSLAPIYDSQQQTRLLFAVRDAPTYWSAVVQNDIVVPLINFSPTSDIWFKYALLTWTGSEYRFERVGSMRAKLPVASTPFFVHVHTEKPLLLGVERTAMVPINVTLIVDLDREQSLFPPVALAAWIAQRNASLVFEGPRRVILDRDDARDDGLVAPNIAEPNVVVIGRRLMRRIARQWWANASGVQMFELARTRSDAAAGGYVLAGAVLILFYLLAYWTVVLADDLFDNKKPSKPEHYRVFRHIVVLVFVGALTHALGPSQIDRGTLVDVAISDAIRTYSIVHVSVSVFVALVGVLVVALNAFALDSDRVDWSSVYVLHSILIARSIVAALLPVGARSALGAVVLLAGVVLLNIMPAVYMAFQLARTRPSIGDRLVSGFIFIAVVVSNVVGLVIILAPVILGVLNAHVSSLAVEIGTLILTAFACILPLYVGFV